MIKSLFFLLLLLNAGCSGPDSGESDIRRLLEMQATSWNKGDIEGFMNSYWKSDSLMFIGKSGITRGWTPTLVNYRKNYPDTAAMGKLSFNLLEIKRISDIYYFVVGKWMLKRTVGDLGGHFTLLVRKINGRWLIVTDHSS